MEAGAKLIQQLVRLDKFNIVKYQLMHYCFVNKIILNDTELNCLSYLGELGNIRLTEFNKLGVEKGILGSAPAINNCINRLEDRGFILKERAGKKLICLHPKIRIESEGNIVINLRLVKLETTKTGGNIQKNSPKTEFAGAVH